MVHCSHWAGLDTFLKKRANVVNTDNLRENAKVNWVEVTKFCGRTTSLKPACPSLEQVDEAPQIQVKLSKSEKPKTETPISSQYWGELWCMCCTGPNMPCTVLFPPIAVITWLEIFDTGVMFPSYIINILFAHLRKPVPVFILTSFTPCFSRDNIPCLTKLQKE